MADTKIISSEFQTALQTLIDLGKLDLRERKTIHYPMHFTKEFEDKYIEELTEDNRTLNALRRFGIRSFGDLIEHWNDVGRIKNMGKKSLALAHNSLMDKYYDSLDTDGKAKFLKDIIDINSKVGVAEA